MKDYIANPIPETSFGVLPHLQSIVYCTKITQYSSSQLPIYIYIYVTPILNNAHIFKNERTLLIIRKNVHLRVSFLKKRPQIIRNITHFQKWQVKVEKT